MERASIVVKDEILGDARTKKAGGLDVEEREGIREEKKGNGK